MASPASRRSVVRAGASLLLPLLLLVACAKETPQSAAPAAAPPSGVGAAPQGATAPAPAPSPSAPAAAVPAPTVAAAPAAAAPPSGALASQDTNWAGVAADVLELRRRGNTLTMKVLLRNGGSSEPEAELQWDKVYVMDAANAKKYEVLRDEKGSFIASLAPSWNDRWHDHIKPGESRTVWAKFPAPPPDVKTVTLQLENMPPFDDLAIQDG